MKTILISGYGSIGRKHASILSKLVNKKNITILTNQKLSNFNNLCANSVEPVKQCINILGFCLI